VSFIDPTVDPSSFYAQFERGACRSLSVLLSELSDLGVDLDSPMRLIARSDERLIYEIPDEQSSFPTLFYFYFDDGTQQVVKNGVVYRICSTLSKSEYQPSCQSRQFYQSGHITAVYSPHLKG
jgi:hypothetical protein